MRIGLLTTSYPRHPHDLAGRFVADLAGWLAGAGHALEVLAPHPAGQDPHPAVAVRALRHVPWSTRLLYGAGVPDNLRMDRLAAAEVPLFVARLAAECRRRRGGWTHVMSHWLAPCGLVAADAAGDLPHLAVAHSSDVTLLARLPGGARLLDRLARPRTALALTSEALRGKLEPLARTARAHRLVKQARVVRMGIRGTRSGERGARNGAAGELHVLFLGRLVEVKGVDLLIQACAPLTGVTLTVAGDGPRRPSLERLAVQTGAAQKVRFVGQKLGPDKEALLREADVLALPSRVLPDGSTDSAPVVLLEAMAAGLPVVATRVGGNEELIDSEHNGLLVPPHQIGPLRDSLARLRDDAALCASLAGRGRCTAAEFTWDRVGPALERMLVDL